MDLIVRYQKYLVYSFSHRLYLLKFQSENRKGTVPGQVDHSWSRSLDRVRWPLYWPTDRFGQPPSLRLKRVHKPTSVSLLCVRASTLTVVSVYMYTRVAHTWTDRRPLSARGQCTVRGQSSYLLSTHILGPHMMVHVDEFCSHPFPSSIRFSRSITSSSIGIILVSRRVFFVGLSNVSETATLRLRPSFFIL